MSILKNKIAVVTGAANGIGRALAIDLARRGASLALSDLDMEGLQQTRALCGPAEIRLYQLNVADKQAFRQHADEVLRDFGTVHLVFNNAGATIVGTVEHTSIEEMEWLLGINLWGVIYGSKCFLPAMLEQRQGWIVNISSVFGLVSYPSQGAYNISKFGVRAFTECLWSELDGSGVEAVCVHPGGIRTNIDKAGRRAAKANGTEDACFAQAQKLMQTPPEHCAADILDGIERGQRRILTGKYSSTLYWLARLLPNRYPFVLKLLG